MNISEIGKEPHMSSPDLHDLDVTTIEVPWSKGRRVRARFHDPRLHGLMVLMVEDTIPSGASAGDPLAADRLATMIWRFPRKILPEVNTHRVFSRNSASSRARSMKTTLRQVMTDPYLPTWTLNRRGMTGEYADDGTVAAADRIALAARDSAVLSVLRLLLGNDLPADARAADWEHWIDWYNEHVYRADTPDAAALSIHKQDANRYLEPWMWHEALVTSSYWGNFLDLRISDAAEPSIHALAVLVKAVLSASTPSRSWIHAPFVDAPSAITPSFDDVRPLVMRSASECARISYRNRSTLANSDSGELGARLLRDRHLSPFEHVAFASADLPAGWAPGSPASWASNLDPSWLQLRHVIAD
jgi:hypothetical protein